jgi:hypothetical protein
MSPNLTHQLMLELKRTQGQGSTLSTTFCGRDQRRVLSQTTWLRLYPWATDGQLTTAPALVIILTWQTRFFSFWAGCFPDVTRDYSLYYRVAANTKDSQSDFIAGPSTTVTLEAPPKTKSLSVETVAATDKWDLRLSWEYQDTDNYYPVCYHTTVTPPCGTASTRISSSPVQASMNCCTTCEWSVTNINRAYPTRSSVNRSNYSTPPLSK